MKFASSFLLIFIYYEVVVAKEICTDAFGYNEKFSKCWRPMNVRLGAVEADELCRQTNGATLIKVDSLLENQGLQTYLHDLLTGNIWIGLYCNASDVSSCYWTHQRGKVEMTYMESPFVKGSPNVDVGNCVTFNGKDGTWASRNCSDRIDVFCELPPTTSDPCDNNYDHHCYSVNQTLLCFPDAQKSCQESCGNLVSIHSELENRYIYSLFPTPGITSIGGIAPSRKTILWSDNSIQVYNNINNEEFQGNCIFMNVNSTLNGQWFGDKCSKPSQFVCKRPTGMKCN